MQWVFGSLPGRSRQRVLVGCGSYWYHEAVTASTSGGAIHDIRLEGAGWGWGAFGHWTWAKTPLWWFGGTHLLLGPCQTQRHSFSTPPVRFVSLDPIDSTHFQPYFSKAVKVDSGKKYMIWAGSAGKKVGAAWQAALSRFQRISEAPNHPSNGQLPGHTVNRPYFDQI